MLNKIKQEFFYGWNPFEVFWMTLFLAVQIVILYIHPDSIVGVIVAISGLLCVVFVSKGKISNYFFGLIFAYTYAYISFINSLYGEMLLSLLVYVPAQFIGFYQWRDNMQHTENTDAVIAKSLNPTQWIIVIILSVIGTLLMKIFLTKIESLLPGLDGATVTLVVIAQILMVLRYKEQWYLWIVVNVVSITLWTTTYLQTGNVDNLPMVTMTIMYLLNSLYGLYNWLKLEKQTA